MGTYECRKDPDNVASLDTVGFQQDSIPILSVQMVELNHFPAKVLILKRNHRMEMSDKSGITDIGLNLDNPTIYGRFHLEGDTIEIEAKYSIQHFNSLAPKRRVKRKLDTVYRFAVLPDGRLQVSPNYAWAKIRPTATDKAQ